MYLPTMDQEQTIARTNACFYKGTNHMVGWCGTRTCMATAGCTLSYASKVSCPIIIEECSRMATSGLKWRVCSMSFELLALAGFYGQRGSNRRHPYIGSMASKLDFNDDFDALVPVEPVENVQSMCILRRYGRRHSQRYWSFESKRYAQLNYRLCHPLAYDCHPLNTDKRTRGAASLVSLLLGIVNERKYDAQDRSKVMDILMRTKQFRGMQYCFSIQDYSGRSI